MKRKHVSIAARIRRERPDIDPSTINDLVATGRVSVGRVRVDNPRALVDARAALVVDDGARELRGTTKLRKALDRFTPKIAGKTALDLGACTGGFTTALLERGARRVYAVDAGFGQLRGSLRLDPRVVNLERTNLGALNRGGVVHVPDFVDVVTADLSYVSLAKAIAELDRIRFAGDAVAVLLVKPMFELALDHAPTDDASVALAIEKAAAALPAAGFDVVDTMRSTQLGAGGAVEGFIYARRRA